MYNELVGLFEVEVSPKPNLWVKAYVKSIIEQCILVTFDNGLSPAKYPFSQCRMPVQTAPTTEISSGSEVELSVELKEEAVKGWTVVTVDDVRGEFFTVKKLPACVVAKPSYVKDETRVPNPNPPMNVSLAPRYHFFAVSVPTSFRDGVKTEENIARVKSVCETNSSINYIDGHLVMITGCSDDLQRVLGVIDFFFHFVKKEQRLTEQIRSCRARLLKVDEEMAGLLCDKIPVESSHIKYVIGKEGKNINRVRNIEGVVDIRVDENSGFVHVYANNEEGLKKACQELTYVREMYVLERRYARSVFGEENRNIRKVVDRSFVMDLGVKETDAGIELNICGLQKNVRRALAMINFIVDSVMEIDHKYGILKETKRRVNGNGLNE